MNQIGNRSLDNLKGVDIQLVCLVVETLRKGGQDFAVTDGVRTIEEQAELVSRGASKTMNSKHLTGHAVDIVPYYNGKVRWEWPLIYPMIRDVWYAANKYNTPLRWGGVWDRPFLSLDPDRLEHEVQAYVNRKKSAKDGSVFLDGPHLELIV